MFKKDWIHSQCWDYSEHLCTKQLYTTTDYICDTNVKRNISTINKKQKSKLSHTKDFTHLPFLIILKNYYHQKLRIIYFFQFILHFTALCITFFTFLLHSWFQLVFCMDLCCVKKASTQEKKCSCNTTKTGQTGAVPQVISAFIFYYISSNLCAF